MKKILVMLLFLSYSAVYATSIAYYGTALCAYPQYECVKVGKNQGWESLFPDPEKRDLVQRLNRTYNAIWYGREIVVPKNLDSITFRDISPFPLTVKDIGEKQIIVDQDKLAYAAYDEEGNLVRWGPISSGRDRCSDSANSCRTLTGIFRVFSKENENCRSNTFDNARMPYCMYFHKGFALHGSNDIPGYRASHGCIRMFTQDALWLNHDFVDIAKDSNGYLGTKVTVLPLLDINPKKPGKGS
ncbi:MAG: endopeptidase IV [Legionellales bacterium RIFCSPHIGHO2_12_FULL_42_9]|nr:MAG: endopeptidase IV [Legionellales bacterium RIFCSPHIGHO2_12_FULL_42_9]